MGQQIQFTALPNGVSGGKLRFSIYVSFRLAGAANTLAGYPVALNWHSHNFAFKIVLGTTALNATIVSQRRADIWTSLFKADTPVKPYAYQNQGPRVIDSISARRLHNFVKGVYAVSAFQATKRELDVVTLAKSVFKDPDVYRSPLVERQVANIQAPNINPGNLRPGVINPGVTNPGGPALTNPAPGGGATPPRPSGAGIQPITTAPPPTARPGTPTMPIMQPFSGQLPGEPSFPSTIKAGANPNVANMGIRFGQKLIQMPYQITADAKFNTESRNWRKMPPTAAASAVPEATVFWWEARRYHQPYPVIVNPPPPALDFHQAVAMIGEHPTLMRLAGIVFDVEVDMPSMIGTSGQVRVQATYNNITDNDNPTTNYEFNSASGVFLPLASGDMQKGWLDIDASKVDVFQVEVPSTVLRQIDFASKVRQVALRAAKPNAEKTQLPSLRSSGFSFSRHDRTFMFREHLTRMDTHATKFANLATVGLNYRDVYRGVRVDVQVNGDGQWRPLCARQGSYELPGGGKIDGVSEEHWVSAAITSAPNDPAGAARLGETLWSWGGWSLVCPRPMMTLDQDGKLIAGGTQLDPRFGMKMSFRPPAGSVAQLRFGNRYKFRARLVDLAGNSFPVTRSSFSGVESEEETYRRFDPVPSPAVFETEPAGDGESTHHIVIRKFVKNGQIETAKRQLVAPQAGVDLCEQHGMFDKNGVLDPAAYALIQQKDSLSPLDQVTPQRIGSQVPLPYFPDPMAMGVLLHSAPHIAATLALNYPGSWPNPTSLNLEVKAGNQPSSASGDQFNLFLVPGEIDKFRISSSLVQVKLPLMGIVEWASAAARADAVWMADNVRGRNWMLTPGKEITAVFATQVPESKAVIQAISGGRRAGETTCRLGGRMLVHNWTTLEVDVNLEWTDEVDLLEESVRTTKAIDKKMQAQKFKVPRREPQTPGGVLTAPNTESFGDVVEFHDTKHHAIEIDLVAHTRFREYFPENWPTAQDPEGTRFTETTNKAAQYAIPSSKRPDAPIVEYVIPTFGWNRRNISGGSGGVASDRSGRGLRVYLRRPWFSSGNNERLAVILLKPKVAGGGGNITRISTVGKQLEALMTRFGADPVYQLGDVDGTPDVGDFSGNIIPPVPGLETEELGDAYEATAIPYSVQFDDERQMWFADIEINAGTAYQPFVRLALARFQAVSLTGLHLSRIVMTDIMALQEDRSAVVSFMQDPKSVKVHVVGRRPNTVAGANRCFATLQEKVGTDDETGWKTVMVSGQEYTKELEYVAPGMVIRPDTIIRPNQPITIPPNINRPPVINPNNPRVPPEGEETAAVWMEDAGEDSGQPTPIQPRPIPIQPRPIPIQPTPNPRLDPAIQGGLTIQPMPGPGEFSLPKSRLETEYRFLVREFEVFDSDTQEPELPDVFKPSNVTATNPMLNMMVAAPRRIAGRLVYVDTVPVKPV